MKPGKFPSDRLKKLLERYVKSSEDVIVGPGIGMDSAVIDLKGKGYLFLKTDPVTFVTEDIGWYSVIINSNDIAVCGGSPEWYLAVILLPEDSDYEMSRRIFSQISATCQDMGISWCGGHTEVTPGIDRPIVVGSMVGRGKRFVTSANARAGDAVILTKGIAIEGTIAVALEKRGEIDHDLFERIMGLRKWLSVIDDANLAIKHGVHAMHDPTEGGLATALNEIAMASGKRIEVKYEKIKILDETRIICELFDLDPLGLLSSGALLATIPSEKAWSLISDLKNKGMWCGIIGYVKTGSGVWMEKDGKSEKLNSWDGDEILRLI